MKMTIIDKTIILLFSLLIALGCQTTKPQMVNNNHTHCKVIIPDIPTPKLNPDTSEVRSPASKRRASQDRIHVIDIAFLYPNTSSPTLMIPRLQQAVSYINTIFEDSSVNAKLRIVAINPIPISSYADPSERVTSKKGKKILNRLRDQLPELRREYGADLAYLILPSFEADFCGFSIMRKRGQSKFQAARRSAVGMIVMNQSCIESSYTFAHEVGHNLGLDHDIQSDTSRYQSFVPGGRGYITPTTDPNDPSRALHGTIMAVRTQYKSNIPRFSSDTATYDDYPIGNAEANASEALLYTIEDASNYAPTVVPENKD